MENSVMLNAVCNEPVSLKVVQEPFYRKGFSPFVNKETGTWWEYDDDKKGFFDTGIIAQGRDGDTVDVRINGESIVQDGVANVPKASEYTFGLVRTQNVDNATRGIYISSEGYLTAYNAKTKNVDNRESQNSISPINLDYAVKAAMCDGKGSEWTADEQAAARERMGIENGSDFELLNDIVCDGTFSVITISTFPNGEALKLRKAVIFASVSAETINNDLRVYVNGNNTVLLNARNGVGISIMRHVFRIESNGIITGENAWGEKQTAVVNTGLSLQTILSNNITQLTLSCTNEFKSGSIIKIYGVRA